MNQNHIEALAKRGMSRHLHHGGLDLWTDGHVLLQATVEKSTEYAPIAKTWELRRELARIDEEIETIEEQIIDLERKRRAKESQSAAITKRIEANKLTLRDGVVA